MKVEDLADLTSSQSEKQLESVARVQDPVNTAQLVEQDHLEDSDDLDESDDSEDDDDEIAASALQDELERAEFEPYTDDGKQC
jgi:NAD-dependent histone deacetylase SIR2